MERTDARDVEEKTDIDEWMTSVTETEEEIAQRMIKWKPYLAYVDDLISKALIQAASTRYRFDKFILFVSKITLTRYCNQTPNYELRKLSR